MKSSLNACIYLLVMLLASGGVYSTARAQAPTWDAAWTGGGAGAIWAFGTAADASGNVFAAGRFAGFNVAFGTFALSNTATPAGTAAANQNGYLAKYSPSGTVLWVRQASVTGFSSFSSVATDAAGNVYATGLYYGGALTLSGPALPAPAAGTRPGFVVKYDAQGNLLWFRKLDTNSSAAGYAVAVAAGGSVYVGGTFTGSLTVGSLVPLSTTSSTDQDPFLVKLDAAGTPLWARQLVGNGGTATQQDVCNAVALDAAGNPALTGYFFSPTLVAGSITLTNAAAGSADIFLAKFDAAGTPLWAQRAGGTGNDFGSGLTATANGNLYVAGLLGAAGGTVAGTSIGANTNSGALLAGYSSAGAGLWAAREGNGSSYSSVGTDPSGNLVVAGIMSGTLTINNRTLTSAGGTDILTARYAAAGVIIGAGRAGGSGTDFAYATCSDPANSQTVVGHTQSYNLTIGATVLNSYLSTQDAVIIKYLANAAVGFATRLTTNGGYEYPTASATDAQGNVYVTGTFNNNIRLDATTTLTSSAQGTDGFVVKYAPAGTVLWTRQLAGAYAAGLATDAAGNVYVTGSFYGSLAVGSTVLTSSGGNSNQDAFLLKYDTQGSLLWARSGGGSDYDEGYRVAVNANGIVAISGNSQSPTLTFGTQSATFGTTNFSPFVVRYDAAGTALLVLPLPVLGNNNYGYSEAAAVDAAGNVFVTGEFTGSIGIGATTLTATGNSYAVFVARISAAGTVQWARQSAGTAGAAPFALATDPAGNLGMTGFINGPTIFGSVTLTPVNGSSLFLAKYDPAGTLQWARQSGGTGSSGGYGLAADAAGNFYLGGSYNSGTPVFGPTTLPAASSSRALVVRYDAQGNPQWAVTPSISQSSSVGSVAIGPNGTLMVTGTYTSFLQFNSTVGVQASESQGTDIFIARLAGAVPLATAAPRTALPPLALYPNPARGRATVALPVGLAGQPLGLRDALGREVRRYTALTPGATEAALDLRGLPAGLYLLRAGEATGKLIIE